MKIYKCQKCGLYKLIYYERKDGKLIKKSRYYYGQEYKWNDLCWHDWKEC